jgi:acyl dehydratase
VNPELVGRVFAPTPPYLVAREKVREFSRAVLSTSPVNYEVDAAVAAGYTDLVAPPTFAIVLQQLTLDQLVAEPDAGIEMTRLVHGSQTFTYARPIVAGDELVSTLSVTSIKSLGSTSMVTAETAITEVGGAHVVTATSILVVQGEAA